MPIAITGMQRSGASMVARVLELAGLQLGLEEAPPPTAAATNGQGTWEHPEFARLNEEILAELGGDWDFPPPLDGSASEYRGCAFWQRGVALAQRSAGHEPWGWKDPASALTFPVWRDLLGELKVVLCLRNPLEVALSLEQHDACSRALAFELWKTYNDRILASTTRDQRLVTHYDAYFARPRDEIERLLGFVGLPQARDVVEHACAAIDVSLRHARFTSDQLAKGKVAPEIVDIYAQLQEEAAWDDRRPAGSRANGSRSRMAQRSAKAPTPAEEDATPRARRGSLRARLAELRAQTQSESPLAADFFADEKRHAYAELTERLRELVDSALPPGAHVAVVSRGDDKLLELGNRTVCHFPPTKHGTYAGSYPADSAAALEALEGLRERKVDYLVFPSTAFWWLDFYEEFRVRLERDFAAVVRRDDTCRVYALSAAAASRAWRRDDAALLGTLELDELDLRLELASALVAHGRAGEAAEMVGEGLALAPESARLHVAMIRCAAALGDRVAAGRHAAEARTLAGDDVTALRELAEAARAIARLSLAEECLAQLIELAPADALTANRLVMLLCARVLKTPGRAVVDRLAANTDRLRSRRLLLPETLFRASEILEQLGRREEALACLVGVLDRTSVDEDARQRLADRLLEPAELVPPQDDPAALAATLTVAGNSFTALHDDERAAACWRLARVVRHEEVAPAFNLAWRAITSGRPLEAMEEIAALQGVDDEPAVMICWPRVDERPWPQAPLRTVDEFESLKPESAPWPRITVITPCVGDASRLEDAIASVLNQGYPDLEYIVVDARSGAGTRQIPRRYARKLEHVLIESDRGVHAAVNEGLRRAGGDLVTWLSPDDMLAPGALFALAAAHLVSGADLVCGFALEHTDRRFGAIDLPALTQETFNVSSLGALFERWLTTHRFSHSQVLFTRRLLETAGGVLREDVQHASDYDLWLRFARAGARVSVVPFPVSLVAQSTDTTTRDADAAVIELADVRKTYATPEPPLGRALDVHRRLRRALSQPSPRVRVVSPRASKIFAADTARELGERFRSEGLEVSFHERLDPALVEQCELVVLLMHLIDEKALREMRRRGSDVPVVGWTWDNHHDVHRNYRFAADVDILIPGHAFAAEYLRSSRYLMGEHVPLCVTQWTATEAEAFFGDHADSERSDSLYGGFVRYAFADKRNNLVAELQDDGVDGVEFVEEDALETYFALSPRERFAQWAHHKTSLCVPLKADVSQRMFDALLTGQIPLVPPDLYDLDAVVPPALQKRLPIVRFEEYTVAAVREAHQAALDLFERDGAAGVRRRHRYALDGHMFANRVREIIDLARALPDRPASEHGRIASKQAGS